MINGARRINRKRKIVLARRRVFKPVAVVRPEVEVAEAK
jgi:hypothetical protein